MYLDEFLSRITDMLSAQDSLSGDHYGQTIEVINRLIDEFAERFTSRDDIVRCAERFIRRQDYRCAAAIADALAGDLAKARDDRTRRIHDAYWPYANAIAGSIEINNHAFSRLAEKFAASGRDVKDLTLGEVVGMIEETRREYNADFAPREADHV